MLHPSKIIIRTGIKQGLYHKDEGTPCQDYLLTHQTDDYVMLISSDGSSSKELSHCGGPLLCLKLRELVNVVYTSDLFDSLDYIHEVQALANQLASLWFDSLLASIKSFVGVITSDPITQVEHIQNIFAATLRWMLITKKWTITGAAGDGIRLVGNDVDEVEHYNKPKYIAYAALPRIYQPSPVKVQHKNAEILWDVVPASFDVEVFSNKGISRWLIASDGASPFIHFAHISLKNHDGLGMSRGKVGGFNQFFESPHFRDIPIAIALRLNVLMDNNFLRHPNGGQLFDDDVSLAIAFTDEVIKEEV